VQKAARALTETQFSYRLNMVPDGHFLLPDNFQKIPSPVLFSLTAGKLKLMAKRVKRQCSSYFSGFAAWHTRIKFISERHSEETEGAKGNQGLLNKAIVLLRNSIILHTWL